MIITLALNPSVDISTTVDRVEPDRKLRCALPEYAPGGGGINVARVIHILGGSATAVWTCGGPNGRIMQRLLEEEALDHRPVTIRDDTRLSFTVAERPESRLYRFTVPGPEVTTKELDACVTAVLSSGAAYVVASGSLPRGVADGWYGDLADAVRRQGGRFVLDTSGPPLRSALEKHRPWMIKPNLREACALTGRDASDERDVEAVARDIVDAGQAEVAVVSLGAAGVVCASRRGVMQISAPSVPVRSAVGAGDSMVAAIVMAVSRGDDLADAVRFGVAAGAAAAMTPGSELCRRHDTERLYEKIRA